jgi:hypothetical protein
VRVLPAGASPTQAKRPYGITTARSVPQRRRRRERAALELWEAMTLIAAGHVPDDVWERAAAVFGEAELAHLAFAIAVINTWNRLMIAARVEPGHYVAGAAARGIGPTTRQAIWRSRPPQWASRNRNFWTLPVVVRGSASTKPTEVGHL